MIAQGLPQFDGCRCPSCGINIEIKIYTEENNMLETNIHAHGSSHRSTSAKVSTGLVFFGVGAAIGAVVALLFAPKSGNELRGEIADVTRKGYDATVEKATELTTELKDQSAKVVQIVKDKAEAVYDLAADKFATGTEAVADVVSATTGAVADGIERMQNESGIAPNGRSGNRKPSSIM
jgi:gas vesicle protein